MCTSMGLFTSESVNFISVEQKRITEYSVQSTVKQYINDVAEWLECWTQAQKGLGSNRTRDAVG